MNHLTGIWQFSPMDDVAYSDIALELARRKKLNQALVKPTLSTIKTTLEHIPRHTTLDSSRSRSQLNLDFVDMPNVLDLIYDTNR